MEKTFDIPGTWSNSQTKQYGNNGIRIKPYVLGQIG